MTDIIREIMIDLNVAQVSQQKAIVADMVSYFDRQTDHDQIRTAIKQRYGQSIRRVKDPDSNTTIESYVNGVFDTQVDAGMIEGLAIGFSNKVTNALATLFTEKGQTFTLIHPEETKNLEDAEKLLASNRKKGGFKRELVRTDKKSVQIGSAILLMSYRRQHVTYQMTNINVVNVYFADRIIEDGKQRSPDTTDIEDAFLVLFRLHQVDVEKWNYLAIYGRSEEYENGRYVEFQGAQEITRVPELHEAGNIEFEINGVFCNPLSLLANEEPDIDIPEYPIVIIKGGTTDAEVLMPYTESLYIDSKEFDTAASHLLGTSQDAARGTNVLERDELAMGKPVPPALKGDIALESGMTMHHEDHDSIASVNGMQVLKDLKVDLAGGYSVPDYMVTSEDHSIEASSGIALQVKTRPLKKKREDRVESTTNTVDRMFVIEKSLIKLFSIDPAKDMLFECEQNWEAGELKLPENKKEAAERIIALMDKGILDTIAGIREYYQLSTDLEAIEIYEEMKLRKGTYDTLIDPPEPVKPKLGLKNKNNFGQPGGGK